MTWYGLEGHDELVERFTRQLQQGRIAGSYLFVGPPGIGKSRFAKQLAQCILCRQTPENQLQSCGQCPNCQQVLAETHPDLEIVRRPEDRSTLPIDLLIGDREHRMRAGFCHQVAMRPSQGHYRVGILHDADTLGQEAANSLLKTLEEPPSRSLIILIASSELRQLPTIRSRCQIVRFRPLDQHVAAGLLQRMGAGENIDQLHDLARLAHGSLELACELADDAVQSIGQQLWQKLSAAPTNWPALHQVAHQAVEAAGKDLSARRQRVWQTMWLVAEYYRQLMHHLADSDEVPIQCLAAPVQRGGQRWKGDEQTAAECLLICHEALGQLEANAHPPTLIDGWLERLRRCA